LAEGLFSITDEDIDMIEGLLQDHHLFYKVKSFTGREIITKLEKFAVDTGETIFSKGDLADYFYIILSGAVEISGFAEGVEGKVLERGQCFGDLGIENKASRSGTAVAKTAVRLLGLRKNHFVRVSL
jgi:CRP-like cAMP-binding protein